MPKANDKSPRQTDEPATEQEATAAEKVEEAALSMMEKEGVLAGLNLNEVAKHAGVTRGLVYHYFGSRRGLLRAAIRRRMSRERDSSRTPSDTMKLGDRVAHAVQATIKNRDVLSLTTLLHLDGSTAPRLMPNAELTLLLLQRDQALGLVPKESDLPALHAAYAAATYGYGLFREVLARDLAIPIEELDGRVIEVLRRLFNGAGTSDSETAD
ncbi:TetR/AcrR family transcriptional regulator [Bradyrhizobium sp.]|uniref:TetR/AcrR family transcriptional regulator n=1 Tax=Bradyrhizobium sp. TaxID=376 RepID=UPI0039E2BDD9